MKKKYKLLDRNLIRHFGKVEIMLDESMGERFVNAGKARHGSIDGKMEYVPPDHKAVFQAPEDKTISELGNDGIHRYPDSEDKLFPHIEK
jgi:hypothetical protein